MGKIKTRGNGISRSCLPYKRASPDWLQVSQQDLIDQICNLARKGMSPGQIGSLLRDAHGIPQVQYVTGQKVLRILKKNGLAPEIPEDLYNLIKRAVQIRKHLERQHKDKDSKYRLILTESRIHKLSRYYKVKRVLPGNWKYVSSRASALVS